MNSTIADSFMAIFGFRLIAKQNGNIIEPVAFLHCSHCEEHHEDGALFCDICGDQHHGDQVPFACETGDGT